MTDAFISICKEFGLVIEDEERTYQDYESNGKAWPGAQREEVIFTCWLRKDAFNRPIERPKRETLYGRDPKTGRPFNKDGSVRKVRR